MTAVRIATVTLVVPDYDEAIDYFVFRIQRELGGLAAALRGLDGVVFCGGIGENSRTIRARVAEGMGWLGVHVDPARNAANGPVISPEGAPVTVLTRVRAGGPVATAPPRSISRP